MANGSPPALDVELINVDQWLATTVDVRVSTKRGSAKNDRDWKEDSVSQKG